MRKKVSQWLQFAFCLFGILLWLLAGYLQIFVSAAETEGSLTLISKTTDGIILDGMEWSIYRVGGRSADGDYELQGEFAKYPISLEDTSATAMMAAANTLETFALVYDHVPIDSGVADKNGSLVFDSLKAGLYLVSGDYIQKGDTYYFFSAFLMEISASADAEVNLVAYPKYISMNEREGGFDYSVRKIWANDESEPENRSVYITAEIYRNGDLYDTVRLDASNDWTYEWHSDDVCEWHVAEVDIPEGYDVIYRTNETQFVIVNTFTNSSSITETQATTISYETETTETTVETISTMTETQESTVTDMTESTTENTNPTQNTTTTTVTTTTVTTETTTTEKIPQTGQLWWPVPLLAAAGLISIAVGVRLNTKE